MRDTIKDLRQALNESPSEKEGKYSKVFHVRGSFRPSMKVPPKRKGNLASREARLRSHAPQ